MNLAKQIMQWAKTGGGDMPYFSDAFIGMWDAEWNSAFGVHDASLVGWNDCSGNGNHLDFVGTLGDFYWAEKGAVMSRFPGNSPQQSKGFLSTSNNLLSGLTQVTFEICLNISASTNFGTVAGLRASSANNRLLWYRQTADYLDPVVSTVSSGTKHLSSTSPYTKDNTFSQVITVNSNGAICFYINGSLYATSSISDFSTIANMRSELGVNRDGTYGQSGGVVGTWIAHRIALHSRAFTAAEVATHWDIDCARFNLTT